MDSRTVVGIGGFPDERMLEYVLELARGRRLLYVPTAQMEDPSFTVEWYERLRGRAEMSVLRFHPWPPADLRARALDHDVILVCGGNTANMLAIWRVHGFERILREAWESGVVLCGWSAGMICWFEAGVTDSFGPRGAPEGAPVFRPGAGGSTARASSPGLTGMRDGLGFLPGSACPHYDGEEQRRPVYRELVAGGFPAGLALDDAAAARFQATELVEVVASVAGAGGYRVGPDGEEPLDTRLLV
jgi:dipeptidase E